MKPLLKYPGGKSRELPVIRAALPAYTTYVEPFLGGGAVFFDRMPTRAYLNDINPTLIQFYRMVKDCDPAFRDALNRLRLDWEILGRMTRSLHQDYLHWFAQSVPPTPQQLADCVAHWAGDWEPFQFLGGTMWLSRLAASLLSKLRRTQQLQAKHSITFGDARNLEHLETAVRAAYYTALRDDFIPATAAESTAAFFFIREYCYGSMYRFNRQGKFNIPYGGINYNAKDFTKKIDHLFSESTQRVVSAASFYNTDFETFFQQLGDVLDDPQTFMFLDPPYDSEFSDYDKVAFGANEQRRLAEVLRGLTRCHWMLVIKDTPLIRSLYDERLFQVRAFQKTYTYNVRGRNNRHVTHLLIQNV